MKVQLGTLPKTQVSAQVIRQVTRGERLELLVYTYTPGARFGVHQHEAEQLTIVLAGELVFTFDTEEIRLVQGEAIVIPSNRPHGAYVPEGAAVTRTYNVFTPVRDALPGA